MYGLPSGNFARSQNFLSTKGEAGVINKTGNTEQLLTEYYYRYYKHFVILCDELLQISWCNNEFLRVGNMDKVPVGESVNRFLADASQLSSQDFAKNLDKNLILSFHFNGHIASFQCVVLKRQDQLLIVAQDPVLPDPGTMEHIGAINNEMAIMTRELSKQKNALEKAYAKINELISTDYLTGLASRKYINESFQKAVSYFKRTATPLTIIMGDLDYFKQVNDQYGHLMGDKVLVNVAKLIKKIARSEDLIGRFGGEEFIIVLVGTDKQGGEKFAERLRQKTEQMKIIGVPQKVTISLGVTDFLTTDTIESAIKRADEAMYMAKSQGRNKVVVR